MKILSFNVKNFMHSRQMEQISALLREMDADIVGLQEVDENTARSGKVFQLQTCAALAGYPYYVFGKNIDFKGGEYGNGILSKYPILSAETVSYQVKEPGDHNRSYMRCQLDVNGKTLCFYNTHLTLQKNGEAVEELKEVCARMEKDPNAVMVGDFNLPAETVASVMEPRFKALNGGAGFETVLTFPIGIPRVSIDNIVVSKNMETEGGITTYLGELSDHNLIYAQVDFSQED
ncbi:MAG: endonuclease/exonuclease/phosphatase family protein [Clostridia bacterium]|nr:endonuclease/exonuclease/phosphatase family protein [Clostridia bacterium]